MSVPLPGAYGRKPMGRGRFSVAVDGDESRADERGVVSKPAVDGVGRDSKERGQRRTLEVEGVDVSAGGTEDVIDHRLDDRLGLVAEQELQNGEVGSGKVRCRREGSEPLRGAVESRLLRRSTFTPQGFCESAQLFCGHPLLGVQLRAVQTGPLPPATARDPVLPVRDPFGERRSLPVSVVKARSGMRKVAGEQVSFVGRQHDSLRIWSVERGYRVAPSDSDVSIDCKLHRTIECASDRARR